MGNIVLGSDGIVVRQGIYEQSSTQKTELGRFFDFEDGRRFRYCKASGAITKGHMAASPAIVNNQKEVAQADYGLSVGDKDNISVLLSAAPDANAYIDGTLICNKGDGLGQVYRIKKNTAAYAPCKVWLYDEVITAVPAASELTLLKNKYLDVVVAPSTVVGVPVGVPLITITTGGYYFWAQTRGDCALLVSGMLVVGENVGRAGTGACSTISSTSANKAVYGVARYVATNDEYAVVDLRLE